MSKQGPAEQAAGHRDNQLTRGRCAGAGAGAGALHFEFFFLHCTHLPFLLNCVYFTDTTPIQSSIVTNLPQPSMS